MAHYCLLHVASAQVVRFVICHCLMLYVPMLPVKQHLKRNTTNADVDHSVGAPSSCSCFLFPVSCANRIQDSGALASAATLQKRDWRVGYLSSVSHKTRTWDHPVKQFFFTHLADRTEFYVVI